MGHFTKIGGTAYEITGGKTKIDGTAYEVSGGKTKIDGTGYDINFGKIPTLTELFQNLYSYSTTRRSSQTAATITHSLSAITVGDVWYAFLFSGGAFMMARIDHPDENTFSQTTLFTRHSTSEGVTRTFSLSGSNLITNQSVYGGILGRFKFNNTYRPSAIDYALTHCKHTVLKYFYNNEGATADSQYRIAKSSVTQYSGICLAAFCNSTASYFSASQCATPTTAIKAFGGSNWLSNAVLREYTTGGTTYITPSTNGSSNAASSSTRSYTFWRMAEDY